jgi:hypothetical protein
MPDDQKDTGDCHDFIKQVDRDDCIQARRPPIVSKQAPAADD